MTAVAVAAVGSLVEAKDSTPADAEREIIGLQTQWGPALVRGNLAALDRLEADDWIGTDPAGNLTTKPASLEAIRGGHYRATQFQCEDISVRLFGTTAVVSVRSTVQATYDGVDCSGVYRFTDVWIKRRGRWQCVASHSSRLPSADAVKGNGASPPAGRSPSPPSESGRP